MTSTPRHLVVDGSNIATEGRSLPSLQQLDEAVRAILAERSFDSVTVIVDATFAHRIEDPEKPDFEAAVDAGEIIMPPAGVVGRGDAFILMVAEKADAAVLSNDSFQEFHGEHQWLFDEGRLIGGKPIEHVGWVFVARVPVRGPASRRAVREAKGGAAKGRGRGDRGQGSKRATGPPPQPSKDNPPPSSTRQGESTGSPNDEAKSKAKAESKPKRESKPKGEKGNRRGSRRNGEKDRQKPTAAGSSSTSSNQEELNAPLAFLGFVSTYSLGDEAEGVVEQFSSHGCYVKVGDTLCYLPSKAMGDPAPSKARDVVTKSQPVTVRVVSLDSERRGVNVELLTVHELGAVERPGQDREDHAIGPHDSLGSTDHPMAETHLTRSESQVAAKKATKKAAKKAPAKKAPAKKAVKKAPAKKAPAKKAVKKAPAKKAPAKKAVKKAPAKKAPAKKAAKKAPAKKAPAKKAAKKAPAKKAPAKKAPAKKAAKKAPAKKAPAKKR